MSNSLRLVLRALCVFLSVTCCSCEQETLPERGQVKGRVTMNGKPVTGADLEAVPVRGRPAYGIIQPDGTYEIMFKKNVPGTLLGMNKFSPIWPTGVRGPNFPPEYLSIQFEVKPGENNYVLDMQSDNQEWVDFIPLKLPGTQTITPVD